MIRLPCSMEAKKLQFYAINRDREALCCCCDCFFYSQLKMQQRDGGKKAAIEKCAMTGERKMGLFVIFHSMPKIAQFRSRDSPVEWLPETTADTLRNAITAEDSIHFE